eukprot:5233036-Amphidinium_carterae.2
MKVLSWSTRCATCASLATEESVVHKGVMVCEAGPPTQLQWQRSLLCRAFLIAGTGVVAAHVKESGTKGRKSRKRSRRASSSDTESVAFVDRHGLSQLAKAQGIRRASGYLAGECLKKMREYLAVREVGATPGSEDKWRPIVTSYLSTPQYGVVSIDGCVTTQLSRIIDKRTVCRLVDSWRGDRDISGDVELVRGATPGAGYRFQSELCPDPCKN